MVDLIINELFSKFTHKPKLPVGVRFDPELDCSFFDPTPTDFNCEVKTCGTLIVNRSTNRFHRAVYFYCAMESEKNYGKSGDVQLLYVSPAPSGAYSLAMKLQFLNDRLQFFITSPVARFYRRGISGSSMLRFSLMYGDPDFFGSALNLIVLNCYVAFFINREEHARMSKRHARRNRT